jgi:phage gpG-like protein
MAGKTVYIVGLDRLLYVLLRKAPQEFERAAREGLEKSVTDIQSSAKRNAPVDTGLLRSSIGKEVRTTFGQIRGVVGTNVEYAPHMEYGTRHTRMPPPGALDVWAQRHGIPNGFLVARAILRQGGLKARRYMGRAFDAHKAEVLPNLETAFARALNRLGF